MTDETAATGFTYSVPVPPPPVGLPEELAPYRLLSSDEAARSIGFPVATLRTWRSRRPGFGPQGTVVGGSVRYRWHDLNEWIRRHAEGLVETGAEFPKPTSALPAELTAYRLLSMQEAALLLGFPVATLRTWRSRRPGFGPAAVVVGGSVRYRLVDLDAWITKHVEGPEGEAPAAVTSGEEEVSQRGRAKRGGESG